MNSSRWVVFLEKDDLETKMTIINVLTADNAAAAVPNVMDHLAAVALIRSVVIHAACLQTVVAVAVFR
ncbi:hypothetical protein GJ496_000820 [Pomphorhynchus laevis]|nr:hypothetical protein GJ496_000820 [Pomphorhynchus laevis]